jgi:carotenoid cleavage dioxygenase-like enzyme
MRPDVVFTVMFKKDGQVLATPTVIGEFGREVTVEVPNVMRALVLAMAPDEEGLSFTSAKMAIFKDNAWQLPKEMSMKAHLSMTPSFEYSVPEAPYRFVVMPRRIVPVSPDGQYLAVGETQSTTIWHFK